MLKQLFPERYPDFCVPVFTGATGATQTIRIWGNKQPEPIRYSLSGARLAVGRVRRDYENGNSMLKPNSIVRVYLKHG